MCVVIQSLRRATKTDGTARAHEVESRDNPFMTSSLDYGSDGDSLKWYMRYQHARASHPPSPLISNSHTIANMEGLIDNAKKFMASEEGQEMQATFREWQRGA